MQEFCQKEAWSEHMDSAHPSSSGFSKVNHKIKINPKCQSCSGIFLSVQSLDEHFKHFCAICPERFCQKEAWIEHSEQSGHSKKPVMVSARSYLELDNNSGLLNVNNQKPELKCQSCSGSFFGRVTLAKHFKHFCSLCSEKFCKEAGMTYCGSLAETVKDVDFVVTALPATAHVEEVLKSDGGIFKNANEGTVICDVSTIKPSASAKFYEEAKKYNMKFLDTPMSGGVTGAERGTLTFMVGGTE